MSRQNIGQADQLFVGRAAFNRAFNAKRGVPVSPLLWHDFGAPALAVADAFIKAATGAELPNAATITYTFPAASASPQDGASNDGAIATPRNVVLVATHGSSLVAMTALVSGLDLYGEPMSELFTITATGTSKTATGKKSFASLSSIAITSAGNATANTVNIGTGAVLGLPFRVDDNDLLNCRFNNLVDACTFVPAVTTDPATTSTGDIRGTVTIAGTLDGAKNLGVLLKISDPSTKLGSYGVTQA